MMSWADFVNFTFIHIPKTGGTSLETLLTKEQAIFHRFPKPPSRPWLSPWHFPPDLYTDHYKLPFGIPAAKKRFCIVRHPKERYLSCQAWSRFRFHKTPESLASDYANWAGTKKTEEHLHRMPQHMFVFARTGRVQCDCVIAFEKFAARTKIVKNSRKHVNVSFPKSFAKLYKRDFELHDSALRAKEFCFRPTQSLPALP